MTEPIISTASSCTDGPVRRRNNRWRVVAFVIVIFVLSPLSALVVRRFIPARSAIIGQAQVRVSASDQRATAGMSAPPTMSARLGELLVAYLDNEGPERRGPRFEQLAMHLDLESKGALGTKARTFSESEMLCFLGPPDLFLVASGNTSYVYFYDRFGKKDWFALITLDSNRNISQIGWNAGSAVDFSSAGWKIFPATAPTTLPIGR